METLSVVVPAYNASATILSTLNSVLEASLKIKQIIVVDDCSTDSTVAVVEDFRTKYDLFDLIEVVQLNENSGPAIARQIGFSKVQTDYVIFFDADDIMKPSVIDSTIERMACKNIPVAIFKYEMLTDLNIRDMWPDDVERFSSLLEKGNGVITNVHIRDALLLTNYPWNKICNTTYLKSISLDFGEFRLHEDVLLHWQILLNAPTVLLIDKVLCRYILPTSGNNATHDKSSLRLICIDVLEWLYDYIWSRGFAFEIRLAFLDFLCILSGWAYNQIGDAHKKEFKVRLRRLLLKLPYVLVVKEFTNKPRFNFIYDMLKRD